MPLRHEGDEFAGRRQGAEIRQRYPGISDQATELADPVVRLLEELVEQPQFVHQLEGRGVNRIATKIAQEIRVFFEHDDVDAGARQQEAEHHPGRAASGYAASGGEGFHGETLRAN